MNLAFEGFGIAERVSEDRGQWFTPPDLAWRMWRWAGDTAAFTSILEPSAGSGNLVFAAVSGSADVTVDAFELDPYYVDRLGERFSGTPRVNVEQRDYLDSHHWGSRYDLGLANPPFEDGLDGKFIAKMMDQCDRIIVLARTCVLNGADRHERVWSRCSDDGDWVVRGIAFLPKRPVFQAGRAIGERVDGGGAKADFCVVKMSRRELGDAPTRLEWWS